jgi:hypothetical protein
MTTTEKTPSYPGVPALEAHEELGLAISKGEYKQYFSSAEATDYAQLEEAYDRMSALAYAETDFARLADFRLLGYSVQFGKMTKARVLGDFHSSYKTFQPVK